MKDGQLIRPSRKTTVVWAIEEARKIADATGFGGDELHDLRTALIDDSLRNLRERERKETLGPPPPGWSYKNDDDGLWIVPDVLG